MNNSSNSFLSTLIPAITAGGSNAVLLISLQLSLTAMLFSQELSVFVPQGIGLLLFGTVIIGAFATITSSHPSCVALVQNVPVALLGLPLLDISRKMTAGNFSSESIFYTLVFTLVLSTLVTGILMLGMARFKLGRFVRFIPYPVIGGFLVGIGWLLFTGGIGVMTGLPVHLGSIPDLLTPIALLKWIPGVCFALGLYYLIRNHNHFMVLPGMVIGGTGVFFMVLYFCGISFSQAELSGWFLGPFPGGALWQPIPLSSVSQVQWGLIFEHAMTGILIFIISTIALLLNASGLELVSKRDIDVNKELKITGIGNILAAFAGSPAGYLGIGASVLSHRLAPGSRLSGVVSSALCGCVLIFGVSLLSGFPRPLAGAMLVLVGLDMLWEWLHDGWFKLPLVDYLLILTILLVIAGIGFMEGVAAGLAIAVILFVVNYSRINIIITVGSGKIFQSNIERPAPHCWILDKIGEQILILQLHGFIFFGTANQLRTEIIRQASDLEGIGLKYIVLDFHKVNGFDSSALNSFERIHQFAQAQKIDLIFVHLSSGFKGQLARTSLMSARIRLFPDLDHGLEWCENQILESQVDQSLENRGQLLEAAFEDMQAALDQLDDFEQLLIHIASYLRPVKGETGQGLFKKGRSIQGIYFIESGQISIQLEQGNAPIRLRTMGKGGIIGDLGNKIDSTTAVVINKPGRFYHLSNENLVCLEKNDPGAALKLYKHMTQVLSERVSRTNRTIRNII